MRGSKRSLSDCYPQEVVSERKSKAVKVGKDKLQINSILDLTVTHDLSGPADLATRKHALLYHRPQLLDRDDQISSLLEWFQGASAKRNMPWRQEWIDPSQYDAETLTQKLKQRAYQVWISEIMLQQTRVETVKSYFINWMSKWPTIHDLAEADPSDVLAAWRGLGYYSRATRIHTAAKKVVSDKQMQGLLPQLPDQLEKQVAGVGPYTAGAISSIVFGHAMPILDGNVTRVLSRQLALYANPKSKANIDFLWQAADALVRKATLSKLDQKQMQHSELVSGGNLPLSSIPGQWNQALMELGSTVCTPKPDCKSCPIRSSCLAYAEGTASADPSLASKIRTTTIVEIEDLCQMCEPIDYPDQEPVSTSLQVQSQVTNSASPAQGPDTKRTKLKQTTLGFSRLKATNLNSGQENDTNSTNTAVALAVQERVENHVKLFPMKIAKKQIRQEDCIVGIIQRKTRQSSEFLVEQRPETGLLASLWQFPSLTTTLVQDGEGTVEKFPDQKSKLLCEQFAKGILCQGKDSKAIQVKYVTSLGTVAHVFSHLKLLMHIHLLTTSGSDVSSCLEAKDESSIQDKGKARNFGSEMGHRAKRKWATSQEVEKENMGTGMRNCWSLVLDHIANM